MGFAMGIVSSICWTVDKDNFCFVPEWGVAAKGRWEGLFISQLHKGWACEEAGIIFILEPLAGGGHLRDRGDRVSQHSGRSPSQQVYVDTASVQSAGRESVSEQALSSPKFPQQVARVPPTSPMFSCI